MALNIVEKADDRVRVRNVLVSVFDKTGLETLAPALVRLGADVRLFSTGGTFTALQKMLGAEAASRLIPVSGYTGQPEMQGGLVKTLDFKIYLGLLSETYNAAHAADLRRTGAQPFDLVVVNLYPFREVTARPGCTLETARTHIDIGGPCMVRAAAKNFLRVAALTDPADYGAVIGELERSGGTLGLATRFALARKAFALTAGYDQAIAAFLAGTDPAQAEAGYTLVDRGEA